MLNVRQGFTFSSRLMRLRNISRGFNDETTKFSNDPAIDDRNSSFHVSQYLAGLRLHSTFLFGDRMGKEKANRGG